MTFSRPALARIAHANGNNVFIYKSADAIATIIGSGYFNEAYTELFQNDIIIAVGSTGGPPTIDVLVVSSASGAATVTTVNGT